MRSEPVTIEGLDGCECSNIKLSDRLRWREAAESDQHTMVPHLLHLCILKDGQRIKTVDEWDEWAGDHADLAGQLFNQCIGMIGTVDAAKKK